MAASVVGPATTTDAVALQVVDQPGPAQRLGVEPLDGRNIRPKSVVCGGAEVLLADRPSRTP